MNEIEKIIQASERLVAACMLNDNTPRETLRLACLLYDAIGEYYEYREARTLKHDLSKIDPNRVTLMQLQTFDEEGPK